MVETKVNYDCAAYVLGVTSIVVGIFISISLAGVVLGIVGLVLARRQKTELSKRAKKLNLIGVIVSILMYILNIILLSKVVDGSFPA